MPADPMEDGVRALMRAAEIGSIETARDWNVSAGAGSNRLGGQNSLAGYNQWTTEAIQYGVGWDGTSTFLPFTANVSFIEASGLSDDIVTGS